jgi:transcriptional regulator with XRE-family HTH domain
MLGRLLSIRRHELGLNVQDIARMTGMAPKQVTALETDNHAYFVGGQNEIERLTKLYAKKLNMSLEAIFSLQANAPQTPAESNNAEVAIPAFLLSKPGAEQITTLKGWAAPTSTPE